MIATSWLGLRTWSEWAGAGADARRTARPLPFLRPALLLWLACLADDEWVALDDLAEHLRARNPGWDRPARSPGHRKARPPRGAADRPRGARPGPPSPVRRAASACSDRSCSGPAMRWAWSATGEEAGAGGGSSSSPPLGRYVLALGPPPPPAADLRAFPVRPAQPRDHRLSPGAHARSSIGRLSRFAWWTKIGAAMELKLTQESVVLGLEGGQTPEQMLEVLTRHSQRAPAGDRRGRGRAVGEPARADHVLHRRHPDRVRLPRRAGPWRSREWDAERSQDVHPGRRPVLARGEPATHPDRPDPHQRRARLSPSPGEVRLLRARRRHPGARPDPVGSAGRCRALPVLRRAARSAPATGRLRGGGAQVRGQPGVPGPGRRSGHHLRPRSPTGSSAGPASPRLRAIRLLLPCLLIDPDESDGAQDPGADNAHRRDRRRTLAASHQPRLCWATASVRPPSPCRRIISRRSSKSVSDLGLGFHVE